MFVIRNIAFSPKYYAQIQERGSTGSQGIAVRCGVIDSGFRNPWFVGLTNTTDKPLFLINPNYKDKEFIPQKQFTYDCTKAIAQAVVIPLPTIQCYCDKDMVDGAKSNRGETGWGASGK